MEGIVCESPQALRRDLGLIKATEKRTNGFAGVQFHSELDTALSGSVPRHHTSVK